MLPTIEEIEAAICRSLTPCVTENFDLHLSIALERLKDELCYDPFEVYETCEETVVKEFVYEPLDPFILVPPYKDLCNIEIITCNKVEAKEIGCEFRAVTRDHDYNADCFNAIEHCPGPCGCKLTHCGCGECIKIAVTATWGCPSPEMLILLAACMEYEAGCDDNVKSKNITDFGSVTYFEKKDPLEKYAKTLKRYSLCRCFDVC